MGKIIKVLMIVALVGGVGSANFVYAEADLKLTEEEKQMIQRKRAKKAEMKKELGLTEEQMKKLETHKKGHRGQGKGYRQKMKALRDELKTTMESADADEVKIRSIHEKIKSLDNEMADHRLEGILQVRKILTPEQFKKFQKKMHKKMHKKMGKMGGHHGMGRKGKLECFKGHHHEGDCDFHKE